MRFGRPDRRTLRFRLAVQNTLAILALLAVAFAGIRAVMHYTLLAELDRLLRDDAQEIALQLKAEDWPRLKEFLDRKEDSHREHGWFGFVTDEGGRVLATSDPDTPRTLDPGLAVQWHGRERVVCEHRDGRVIVAGCSDADLTQDIDRLTTLLLGVGLAVLVAAPLAGYWLAGRAIRPVADIIATTSRLQPNRLDERLPLRGTGDELDQLSGTINGGLDVIAEYIRRQQEFVANVAHELRTPLTALRSSVDGALERDRAAAGDAELLEDLSEQCEGLANLVNRLLLLAEGDAGFLRDRAGRVDLAAVTRRATEMFRGIAEHSGVTLTVDLAPAAVVAHAGHLQQVVQNLLDNALKFTPAGGRVSVTVATDASGVVLRLADTGPGVPPEDLPLLFRRFFRGDRSRRRSHPGGTGLGLSICQSIVEAYGGTITLANAADGGAVATVTLPPAPPE